MSEIITMQGNELHLTGTIINVGDKAPNFTVFDNDLKPVSFSDLTKKTYIFSAVPSLDTPVCDTETRRFNKEAPKLNDNIEILTISMDLPFAQKRWCGNAGIDKVKTLSDFNSASFGTNFGVLIKELRLLTRAVFIVNAEGIITYKQLVKEITNEPNYEEILNSCKF